MRSWCITILTIAPWGCSVAEVHYISRHQSSFKWVLLLFLNECSSHSNFMKPLIAYQWLSLLWHTVYRKIFASLNFHKFRKFARSQNYRHATPFILHTWIIHKNIFREFLFHENFPVYGISHSFKSSFTHDMIFCYFCLRCFSVCFQQTDPVHHAWNSKGLISRLPSL